MTQPIDPRLLLLALSAQRLLDALNRGDLAVDAPDDQLAAGTELLDQLALRISQALAAFDSPEKAMARMHAAERLAHRLLDPDDLGFTANAEIRDAARVALGITPVETCPANLKEATP